MNMSSEPDTEPGPHGTSDVRREEIELRAYFKYCERGCAGGLRCGRLVGRGAGDSHGARCSPAPASDRDV
jgi:hypothetical protein